MSVKELALWFAQLQLTDHEQQVAQRLLSEINNRLHFLEEVGLNYLTLDRLSNSLSGGESQRINLSTSLGSSLVGSLYILDEPSIGLHSRDTERLVHVLQELRDVGNTVIVVEHDEDIMRAADHIIDIGPEAGRLGGQVVWTGDYRHLADKANTANTTDAASSSTANSPASHTLNYLLGRERIQLPASRRKWNRKITVKGARENNLKGIDVDFPLNVFTVVTGVSGSGKSTLVRNIFYPAIQQHLNESGERPGEFQCLEGDLKAITAVDFVDQNPIGRSSRSNPVTYVKAYDEIRKLMAEQALAKQMEMKPAFFSFNAEADAAKSAKAQAR